MIGGCPSLPRSVHWVVLQPQRLRVRSMYRRYLVFISLYRSLWSISSSVEQAPHLETKEGESARLFHPYLFGEVRLRDHLGGVPWDKLLVATRGQEAHCDRTDELSYMLVGRTPIGE